MNYIEITLGVKATTENWHYDSLVDHLSTPI